MEQGAGIYSKPMRTMRWLGLKSLYVFGLAFVLALVANGIDAFASTRVDDGLLKIPVYNMLTQSIAYCFGVIAITLMSLVFVEIASRKGINYLQFALIALALTLFYLLLLALSEKMPYVGAYVIVCAMTIGLITLYVKGITHNMKAVGMTAGILVVEYAVIFMLIKLESAALLIGSIILFLLIALAMFFTLKLKVVNDELTIK
jgi:inner membrane creD family protein